MNRANLKTDPVGKSVPHMRGDEPREGDIANYSYYDNLGRGLKYAGTVIVDLVPHIYDTPRILRILGEDDSVEQVPVNQPMVDEKTGMEQIFDLTVGKYDVIVSIGPSYESQREEAADGMMNFLNVIPEQARMILADLVVKNLDWPGADEFVKRLKMLLPPGMAGDGEGGPPPPSAPPPPDPAMIQQGMVGQADLESKILDNRKKRDELARMEMGIEGDTSQSR